MPRAPIPAAATCALLLAAEPAVAATALPGAKMQWAWTLPFVALLLSIAIGPLVAPRLWHAHYGKIAGFWALLAMAAIAVAFGATAAIAALVHAVIGEYLSFIVLLFALYTAAGGVLVTGNLRGTPGANLVAIGS
jgi:Na+/H+ antiporter NhaD/arsenite permease-like protein